MRLRTDFLRSPPDTCYAWQAKGQLRAIGTALHLKQRFGAGYQVINFMPQLGATHTSGVEWPQTMCQRERLKPVSVS